MLEREALKKYHRELGAALLLYLAVLFVSIGVGKSMAPGTGRTLLVLTPVIPILLTVWAIARQFRRLDEYVRLRSLEGLAIAAAITAGVSFTYGFLEGIGFPKLSMFWIWPAMGLIWGMIACVRRLVSR